MSGPRVLVLGPLDSIHLRRWCELAAAAGCEVAVAGHLRAGTSPVDLDGVAAGVRRAPALPWSGRLAELEGSRARAFAARRGKGFEPFGWAAWLRAGGARLRADIVHAHMLDQWGAAAALAARRPLVVSSWGSDVYLSRGAPARLARLASRRADLVTAPSPDLRAHLTATGAVARQVELGVDTRVNRPLEGDERLRARDSFGFGDGPVVLSFRAPTALYRLDSVIGAVGRLAAARPDLELALAHGPLPLPAGTRGALRALGGRVRVHALGDVPAGRMPALLAAADLGVSFPISDGSPRSVWECLACGTPVVLSDLPQLRGRIGEGRGADFAGGGAEALAAAIDAALTGLGERRRRSRERGRAWVGRNAGLAGQAARLRSAYEEAVATRR